MVDEPIVAASALKHGLEEGEILHAYRNPIRVWDLGEDFTMVIATTPSAAIIEVGYTRATPP